MKKSLPIGIESFEKLRDLDYYYIDKTNIIEELLKSGSEVTLFPRPRRFGKSLFLSMIECYFSIEKKKKVDDLFEGLSVEKSEIAKAHKSKYPVVSLNFKSIKADSAEATMIEVKERMSDVYMKHSFLKEVLNDIELDFFKKIEDKSCSDFEWTLSLQKLTVYLERYYNEKVIVLIDEYDAAIDNAFNKDFYDDIIGSFKSMYAGALKGNNSLKFSCMTGVVRVSSESMFSELNHIDVYGVVDNDFSEYFGFTENEVVDILKNYDLSDYIIDVRKWYNGYRFGETRVYNPWSILNFVKRKNLSVYWINSGENNLLNKLINGSDANIKADLIKLLNGEEITTVIDEKISYKNFRYAKNEVFTMLLLTGYLTVTKVEKISRLDYYSLKIPNEEVMMELEKMLYVWTEKIRDASLLKDFTNALLEGNAVNMESSLNDLMLNSLSYYDNAENFYHGFILGLLFNLGEGYTYKSNRESGYGRFDIMTMAKDKSFGCVFEFKYAREESMLEGKLKDASEQILEKKYDAELVECEVKKIYRFAIAINEKKARVLKVD